VLLRKPSQLATDDVPGLIELVYIDGAHAFGRPGRTSSGGAKVRLAARC